MRWYADYEEQPRNLGWWIGIYFEADWNRTAIHRRIIA